MKYFLKLLCLSVVPTLAFAAGYGDERDQIAKEVLTAPGKFQSHFTEQGFRTRAEVARSLYASVPRGLSDLKVALGSRGQMVRTAVLDSGNVTVGSNEVATYIDTNPENSTIQSAHVNFDQLSVFGSSSDSASEVLKEYEEQYELLVSAVLYGIHDRSLMDHAGIPKTDIVVHASRSKTDPMNLSLGSLGFTPRADIPYGTCVSEVPFFMIGRVLTCIPKHARRNEYFYVNLNE